MRIPDMEKYTCSRHWKSRKFSVLKSVFYATILTKKNERQTGKVAELSWVLRHFQSRASGPQHRRHTNFYITDLSGKSHIGYQAVPFQGEIMNYESYIGYQDKSNTDIVIVNLLPIKPNSGELEIELSRTAQTVL